ncbi:MAG: hypothetical protein ACOC1Z_02560 [Cyanobacteriota bacterium]
MGPVYSLVFAIAIPISFSSATVSVASREQDALTTFHLMVFIWNHYNSGR